MWTIASVKHKKTPKADVLHALSSESQESTRSAFETRQLKRWASSKMIPRPSKLTAKQLHKVALTHDHNQQTRKRKKLDKLFATEGAESSEKKDKCGGFCVNNNQCHAAGCVCRPLHSHDKHGPPAFRCQFGVHLCHRHGLYVNVNNGRSKSVTMKDGRILDNVFIGTAESDAVNGRARRSTTNIVGYSVKPNDMAGASLVKSIILDRGLSRLPFQEALDLIIKGLPAGQKKE